MDDWPVEYDANDFVNDIPEPNLTPNIAHNLGMVFVWWSILENQVDILFACLFRIDPTHSMNITENMTFKTKMASLNSANYSLRKALGDVLNDAIEQNLKDATWYASNVRNLLAHGKFEAGGKGLFKFSAHRKLQGTRYELDPDHLGEFAVDIQNLANEIRRLIPRVVEVVKPLSAKDFHDIVVIND